MTSEDQASVGNGAGAARGMRALYTVYAQVRRLTFTGNRELRLDAGGRLRPDRQGWSRRHVAPAYFEGGFCIPLVNVEVGISQPLGVPVRMRLRGAADNGMLFAREFTFPAGKDRRLVRDVEAHRAVGGVFDFISCIRWELDSDDVHVYLEDPRLTAQPVYFVPCHELDRPPHETELSLVCTALRGLPCGHPEAVERLWRAFEPLDIACADGVSRLSCAGRDAGAGPAAAEALLKTHSGGLAAWTALFDRCVSLSGYRRVQAAPSPASEPSPWTVDDRALKLRLLDAKCRQALRGGRE